MIRFRPLSLALLPIILAGCASPGQQIPEPLRRPLDVIPEESAGMEESMRQGPRVVPGPRTEAVPVRVSDPLRTPVKPGGKPISLVLDSVNLTAFIDEVFGNQLGFSLEIDPAVRSKTELVSLRLVQPEPPHRLYEIAVEVLKNYQVAVLEESGRLRFAVAGGDMVDPPRLLRGRSLPEVPAGQRPVFVVMPLDVADPGPLVGQLRALFSASEGRSVAAVQMTPLLEANAVLLSGPPALVEAAMEAIQLLDSAGLREKKSLRITPEYLNVEQLAKELREVLVAQGISVKARPVEGGVLTFVPVASANSLIVFSESDTALQAVVDWVELLDQPGSEGGAQSGAYIYQVKHTTAESLRVTAEALIGAGSSNPAASPGQRGGMAAEASARPAPSPSPAVSQGADGSRIVIDPTRNAIIFQGDASRWRTLRSVLARLDQPARQVLIEVTVAEVSLTGEFSHGVEWALRNAGINDFGGSLVAYGGSVANRGVVWRPLSSSGQVRAVMNLFQNDSRVSILSTPRLMVRSGEAASIDVGTEVPILTSQATAPDLGGGSVPSILQQVSYRKTGVLLNIEPVVHSSQRVDLKVAQEVSEAKQTESSSISSPSIFSRRLETALSLSDGQAMIMGGLIRDSRSEGGTQVPGLGRLPLLGPLFGSRTRSNDRTELLVLITPYIVEDASQAREITEALRGRMELLPGSAASPAAKHEP